MRVSITGTLVALITASLIATVDARTDPPVVHPGNSPRSAQVLPLASGMSADCTDRITGANVLLTVLLPVIGFPTLVTDFFADEGWVWVEPNGRRIRNISGLVRSSGVAAPDSYANHDSHDFIFNVRVDQGQEDRLTPVSEDSDGDGNPDTIHVEWETGITPGEKSGDGSSPMFPKWAWPSAGDRVWVEGNWVYDCGHEEEEAGNDLYYSEIHPARAVASMRDQAATLPGSGDTPVPVTKTDLYIHGRGGYVVDQLNCGLDIIYNPFADCPTKTTPIDSDVTFDVCLPPQPDNGIFSKRVQPGPLNTVAIEPDVRKVPAGDECRSDSRFDQNWMARVSVPLGGSGITPEAVYARQIYAGWITASNPVMAHRRVTLTSMDLDWDHDDLFDGELTFTWMNLDRAGLPWLRLADFTENMNDFGSDSSRSFSGAVFDFYLRNQQDYTIRSLGMDQDCMDGAFGFHYLTPFVYLGCFFDVLEFGRNDELKPPEPKSLDAASLDTQSTAGDDYTLWFDVEAVAIDTEDVADLSVATSCVAPGEVALVGEQITCSSRVANPGPGLPRSTTMNSMFGGTGAAAVVDAGTWSVGPLLDEVDHFCSLGDNSASCSLQTVQVGGHADAVIAATPTSAGLLTQQVSVSTLSTDPVSTNNTASATVDVFLPVLIDIMPGDQANVLNLRRGGLVAVAILTTPDFNAASVDPSSVCFGDADTPGARACAEAHLTGHMVDVNRDREPDLVLHYLVSETGIELADSRACLKGRTRTGIGIYGCQAVSPTLQ